MLSPDLQAFLLREGFSRPTPAQDAAIPTILSGAHTLLIAPTGMGKTESAVIPILDSLIALKRGPDRPRGISVVYVTPLRALNRDLSGRLEAWGRELKIDVAVRHGDTPQAERSRQSRKPPDILITTPETLQVMFLGRKLKASLASVRWVVVDEVHELAEDERGAQLACALERLAALAGEFQRIGLSATVGDAAVVARFLAGPTRAVATVKVPVAKRLDLRIVSPKPDERATRTAERIMSRPDVAAYLDACLDMIRSHTSTLLFVNTRETAEVLTARVRMLDPDFPLAVHHGSLAKEVRIAAEEAFKSGAAKGLVCTSSMELGIDIGSADLVIQYTSPRQATRLVQRVGRAGHRADLVSNGVIVATDADDAAEAAVIVDRTLREAIEKFPSHASPLDVLVNQLAAMALESGRLASRGAYELLRKSAPFAELSWDEFDAALKQLAGQWVVWYDGTYFGSKARTRTYFHENISMIPDSKTYRVVNIATNRSVATLDEGFVASFVEPGAAFIAQGHPWRVAEVDSEEAILRVEPIKDPLGAVPSWVGEEIPVPFEVAQEVGQLRRTARELLAQDRAAAETTLWARYRLDPGAAASILDYVAEQEGYELPTEDVVTLESGGRHCVVNGAFGTKVNETLGRLLSSLLSARTGTSVGLQIDPYRVILEMPARTGGDAVKRLLLETSPEALPSLMELVLTGSHYLRYRMVHVARKFGVLSRDIDYKKVNVARLLDLYKGTPLWRETMREVLHDRLDVPAAQEVLRKIQSGKIRLFVQGLSPIGAAGMDKKIELVSPARADRTLLAAMRQRLENEKIVLLCMNCKEWSSETRVARASNVRSCPKCAGVLIAAVRPWHKESLAVWKKARGGEGKLKKEEERKELVRLATTANLVFDHGEKALLALVARGVGPDTAGRLLHRQRSEDDQFLRDVLEAEITYARTRAFWD